MVSMHRPPSPDSRTRSHTRTIPRIYRQPTDIHFDLPSTPTGIPQVIDLQFDGTNPAPQIPAYESYPSSPQERDMPPDFLVQAAQASRLRRRGAIRIENSTSSSAPQRDHTSERAWSVHEEHSRVQGPTITPLIISKEELGAADQVYSLYCGGIASSSASAAEFKPSPLPYASTSYSDRNTASTVSTGCGSLIHHRVTPSQRLGLWVGNALATPLVATLDPTFCDQDLEISEGLARYTLSAGSARCGCILECIGCTVCGNFLGYQIQCCYRHFPASAPPNHTQPPSSSTSKRPPIFAFDPRATSYNSRWPTPFPLPLHDLNSLPDESGAAHNSALGPNTLVTPQPRSNSWDSFGDTRNSFPRTHSPPPILVPRRVRYPANQPGEEEGGMTDNENGGYLEDLAHTTPFVSILERRLQYNHMDLDDDDDDVEVETIIRPSIMSDALRPLSSVTFRRLSSLSSAPAGSRQHHRSTSPSSGPVLVRSLTSSSFADPPSPSPAPGRNVSPHPLSLASPASSPSPSPHPPTPAPTSHANVRTPSAPSIMMLSRRPSSLSSIGYRPAMRSPLATAPVTPSLVVRRSSGHLTTSSTMATHGGDDDDNELPGLVPVTRFATPLPSSAMESVDQENQSVVVHHGASEGDIRRDDSNMNAVAGSSTAPSTPSQENSHPPSTTYCDSTM